jgi:NADPH-dependent glutamate synthase beta subunit-like oxidoreductase
MSDSFGHTPFITYINGFEMEQSRLHELEEQCIQNCDPPCTAHCPVHVNIRKMLQLSQEGDFSGAYQILNKSILFPEIIARTCEQPCQNGCNGKTWEEQFGWRILNGQFAKMPRFQQLPWRGYPPAG